MYTTFILRAELISTGNNISERNVYQRQYRVKKLKEINKNATVYDKELKIYFEDKSALKTLYEIETVHTCVDLCDRLRKASDLICRCGYIYDSIRLVVNALGLIVSVENRTQLKNNWDKLRVKLLRDYKGSVVNSYLEELDDRFIKQGAFKDSINQYFYFGLLFPPVPINHSSKWNNKRLAGFSEFEEEKFEEIISYDSREDNIKEYNVIGNACLDSDYKIEKYEGQIRVPSNESLILEGAVEVKFSHKSIINEWNFNIHRQ